MIDFKLIAGLICAAAAAVGAGAVVYSDKRKDMKIINDQLQSILSIYNKSNDLFNKCMELWKGNLHDLQIEPLSRIDDLQLSKGESQLDRLKPIVEELEHLIEKISNKYKERLGCLENLKNTQEAVEWNSLPDGVKMLVKETFDLTAILHQALAAIPNCFLNRTSADVCKLDAIRRNLAAFWAQYDERF